MYRTFLMVVILLVTSNAYAGTITSIGSGTAVSNVDRMATFDNIAGSSLSGYTEDSLTVSVGGGHCCFPGIHYDSAGNYSFVTISTSDGIDFFGLELDFGTGFGNSLHNVVWETKKDGLTTESGLLTNIFATTGLSQGFSVLGWSDTNLFDTLMIGAAPTSTGYNAFGQHQAIALDNVKIDFGDSTAPVPEPGTMLLMGSGLASMLGYGWRKRKQQKI